MSEIEPDWDDAKLREFRNMDRSLANRVFEEIYSERLHAAKRYGGGDLRALDESDDAKVLIPDTWVMWLNRPAGTWNDYKFPSDYSRESLAAFRVAMVKVANLALAAILWVDRRALADRDDRTIEGRQ